MRGRMPLVLCYHAVSDAWEDDLAVDPEVFQAQIRLALRSGFTPVSLSEAVIGSGKLLHITFDDAFRNIRGSLDFLARVGVPATVFVCSDLAATGSPLPIFAAGGARAAPGSCAETMTWDALRELAAAGVEIGSHTCSHPHLTTMLDIDLRRELTESRERIGDELGQECAYLAYPFGEQNARVRAAARAAGYTASFAQASTVIRRDPQAIFRISIYGRDSLKRVALKLSPLGRVMSYVRRSG